MYFHKCSQQNIMEDVKTHIFVGKLSGENSFNARNVNVCKSLQA